MWEFMTFFSFLLWLKNDSLSLPKRHGTSRASCLENDGYTWGQTKALDYIANPCSTSFHKLEIKTIIRYKHNKIVE